MRCPDSGRIVSLDFAQAVGRFNPSGPEGYRAATLPDAPLRKTRAEAMEDERLWRVHGSRPVHVQGVLL